MADKVISSADYIRPVRSPYGQHPINQIGESTTGQTWTAYGDLLQLGASTDNHRCIRASTTGSTCNSVTLIGVAAQPASGVQDTPITYYEPFPEVSFWARSRGGVLGSSCVGTSYGFFRDSSKNVWLVDFGNKVDTSCRCIVTRLVDDIGDSGGAVHFRFGSTNSTLVAFPLLPL